MNKSNYCLVWYDNGKLCYKIFLCTLAEITLKLKNKQRVFPKARFIKESEV